MEETGLTTFAWIFMLVSMGAVTVLMGYCFWRILRNPRSPGSPRADAPSEPPPSPRSSGNG